jgi:hypothetical protein
MAENEPLANVQPPANVPDEAVPINVPAGLHVKLPESILQPAMNRMLKEVESERKGRVLLEKKLAGADLLVEKTKREATVLLAKMKHEKLVFSDILKSQKVVAKRELDAEAAMTAGQLQLKKDAQASKAAIQRELKLLKVGYESLQKVGIANKTKISALNFAQTSWMKTKAGLQAEVRDLSKDLKALTKKFDAQLKKKLDHELSIQKLRNESKKLELELVREKLNDKVKLKKVTPSTTPKKSASLTLLEKKEFENHKAEVKRLAKDNDATREKLKKDNKAADVRSNLGFAANMLQNRVNGGLWQTGTVADVSSCLFFVCRYFPFFCLLIY